MSRFTSNKMRIAGITAAIPNKHTTIYDLGSSYFDKDFIDTMHKTVGVEHLYICEQDQSSGDLGYAAADRLLESLGWERESLDALIFISQTLDYIIPPTSAELQFRLKLSNDTFIMDLNYGCAGFVAGLMVANQFIHTGHFNRILIVNAECHRRFIADQDRESSLLFSDGASAVAVESSFNETEMFFSSHIDGSHAGDITLGAFKSAANINRYGKNYSYMNGEVVTQYMLRNIPKLTKGLLDYSAYNKEDIDTFLFHQANAHMIKYISKRMKLDLEKVPVNIENFGNVSSVTIPLLICDKKKELFLPSSREKVMMVGFGAGFLLSAAVLEMGSLKGGDIIFV